MSVKVDAQGKANARLYSKLVHIHRHCGRKGLPVPSKHDSVREAVEQREREKREKRARERAEKASMHRRKIIGENIGRIRRGES